MSSERYDFKEHSNSFKKFHEYLLLPGKKYEADRL